MWDDNIYGSYNVDSGDGWEYEVQPWEAAGNTGNVDTMSGWTYNNGIWNDGTNTFDMSYLSEGSDIGKFLKSLFGSTSGKVAGTLGLAALANRMFGDSGGAPAGYQGSIPRYTATRQMLPIPVQTTYNVGDAQEQQRRAAEQAGGIAGTFAGTPREREVQELYASIGRTGNLAPSPEEVAWWARQPEAMTALRPRFLQSAASFTSDPVYGEAARRAQTMLPEGTPVAASRQFRRPGSGGITYFTPMVYTPRGATPEPTAAPAATTAPVNETQSTGAAAGGIMGVAQRYNLGGYSDGGRLLRGPGDGVSDSIPATIGEKQPARLADGEFVIPARIVSELGNGSTEAGARKLYAMMDRVKKARMKSKKNIAVDSKADKHLPA